MQAYYAPRSVQHPSTRHFTPFVVPPSAPPIITRINTIYHLSLNRSHIQFGHKRTARGDTALPFIWGVAEVGIRNHPTAPQSHPQTIRDPAIVLRATNHQISRMIGWRCGVNRITGWRLAFALHSTPPFTLHSVQCNAVPVCCPNYYYFRPPQRAHCTTAAA